MKKYDVTFEDYSVTFAPCGGGFPTKLTQFLRNARVSSVVHTEEPWLKVKLSDGRIAQPSLPADYTPRMRKSEDGAVHVQYNNIPFLTDGEQLGDWRFCLELEFTPDGNGFMGMTYVAMEQKKPCIDSFCIRIPMDFGSENDVTYEYWPRPKEFDPTGIRAVGGFARNLTEKKAIDFGWTVPMIGFDFGREGRPSRHIEWFMEDQMGLDNDPTHVSTHLTWEDGSPVVEYEFAPQGVQPDAKPYYWRNKLGFTLGQTPKFRDKAPLRLYHYIDEFDNLPTVAQVRKMAAEGADVLALHECWRSDIRNGGNPFDEKKFIEIVEECHRHDIRVTPYIRGDGESAKEDACSWFDYYLIKNYDGIYSDYASPFGFYDLNLGYSGGHFGFKAHYRSFQRIRDTVGRDGILTLHLGPFFGSAALTALADGYVSGEGERGIMLRSRRENAFFSETTTCPGSLWTGAFPAYRTKRMLPFMANIGQFPHVMLGEQWKSTSLALSQETGNATFARPLWKLYGLMKDERRIHFDNDLCDETIVCDSYDTGLSRFIMQDGSQLYLMSNFADYRRTCSSNVTLDPKPGQKIYKLHVGYEKCWYESVEVGTRAEAELDDYGICGFLMCNSNTHWAERLDQFTKPYPEKDAADLAYEKKVQKAAANRFIPKPAKTLYLKAEVPTYTSALEPPFWNDTYDKIYKLFATDVSGKQKLLGYISKKGLTAEEPAMTDALWAGDSTGWIPLHTLLGKGKYHLESCAYVGQNSAAQKLRMWLSEDNDLETAREILFMAELDEDRSRLTFDIEII